MSEGHGMRPLATLLPHSEALRLILETVRPVEETERVPLQAAHGRILSEPLRAPFDVPPFDRAAMDGYAVRALDAAAATETRPARLKRVDVVHAGGHASRTLGPGECIQIATGAPLPPGADAVVPVELTRLEGSHVAVVKAARSHQHVSFRGSDMRRDTEVLRPGVPLTPARVAVAAAVGCAELMVWRRPRVAVASTGSELKTPGAPLGPGEIYDSNGPGLRALLETAGARVTLLGNVADDVETLRRLLQGPRNQDLLLLSGGSSAGERDVLRDAVRAEGEILFHGVQVKPGKPLLLGRVGTTPILGLPGYPTSCLSDAYLFVLPALRKIARMPPSVERRVSARLGERVASVPGRLWFLPVRLENGLAIPTYKESGATTSLADAVGYVEISPDLPYVEAGEPVQVVLF